MYYTNITTLYIYKHKNSLFLCVYSKRIYLYNDYEIIGVMILGLILYNLVLL